MGKPKKRVKKYNYTQNRRKVNRKSNKLPRIECDEIRKHWNIKKTVKKNLQDMGISADPNETIKLRQPFDEDEKVEKVSTAVIENIRKTKGHVVKELEEQANVPYKGKFRLPDNEVDFCTYMLDKHGDDYKAMAKDKKNYYQETPKQIRKKILKFKSIPEHFNHYLDNRKKKDN